MHLESVVYPKDWQTLSGDDLDLDLGTGDPVLVDGLVFQVGKTDIANLLRQGHLGGEGQVASLPICSGDPDGGRALEGSVGDGLLLLPGADKVFAFMGPAGLPPPPVGSSVNATR
jgi:hypothetical protein